MNSFVLKMIAIIAMTIDHVGYVFFPHHIWMRVTGRLTMPIIAFLTSEGFRYTRDIDKYIKRMFLFSIITIVPFYLLFKHPTNVLFAYTLALLGLKYANQEEDRLKKILILIGFALLSLIIASDWPLVGVLMVYVFYYANYNKKKIIINFSLVYFLCYSLLYLACVYFDNMALFNANKIQFGLFLSLPLIFLYNHKQGLKVKYLFYWYYPLHLLVIYLISLVIF